MWAGSFGGGDNPPLPTKPGQDPNEQLTYLQALNVILNTAIDALSKHSSVIAKKQVLNEFKSDLLAMGKVIEFYGLHNSFKTEFNELFSLGYDVTDNLVSWQEAVSAGWKFAKAVALDSKPVRLKAFQSQVFGMVRGITVRENMSVSASQEEQLKQTLDVFSLQYARLKPVRYIDSPYNYRFGFEEMIWGNGFIGRMGTRWGDTERNVNGATSNNGWMGSESFNDLQRLVKGLTAQQVIDSFENSQVLINAATRTAPLWRSADLGVADVRRGEFLRELIDTGFELARVGATNPTTVVTNSSAWLEGVLEKKVQLVAGGLGQFILGFENTSRSSGTPSGTYARYTNIYADALDYGQRLMRAAAGVQDLGLRAQILQADTLSELVNLGGAYAALNPLIDGANTFPLELLWNGSSSQNVISKLESFLNENQFNNSLRDSLNFLTKVTFSLNVNQSQIANLSSSEISSIISMGSDYHKAIVSGFSATSSQSFFESIYYSSNKNITKIYSNLIVDIISGNSSQTDNIQASYDASPPFIASSDKPSQEVIDKIAARYWRLVDYTARLPLNEGRNNLIHFLEGSGKARYMSFNWLNSFKTVQGTVQSVQSKLGAAIATRALDAYSKLGVIQGNVLTNLEVTRSYSSNDAKRNLDLDLLLASGAANVKGLTNQFSVMKNEWGNLLATANIEYYWYDDYNWNPGQQFDIIGLGRYYDDEANLLVKYASNHDGAFRTASPFSIYSGWDQKMNVIVSRAARLKEFQIDIITSNQDVKVVGNRYIPSIHAPWIQRDIDRAQVRGDY